MTEKLARKILGLVLFLTKNKSNKNAPKKAHSYSKEAITFSFLVAMPKSLYIE